MMRKLVQVDFSHPGPFGQELAEALKELAESINQEPGFIWKIWTESEEMGGKIFDTNRSLSKINGGPID